MGTTAHAVARARPRNPLSGTNGARSWMTFGHRVGRRGFLAVAALFAGLAAQPALAGTATPLSLTSFGSMAVDDANEQVFVSGGQFGSSIVVLDFDGNILTTITREQGANGMALDSATGTLYVALQNANAISKIDTATLAETSRFATTGMSEPRARSRTPRVRASSVSPHGTSESERL